MEIDARARCPFDIRAVRIGDGQIQVEERALVTLPFARLTSFTSEGFNRRQVLIVPPLAGSFAILLRDFVIALLRHGCDVAIVDWHDACYVPVSAGRFGHLENVLYIRDMICMLGRGAHVVAVCQGVVPALAATALLSRDEPENAPCSLVLMGGPVDPWSNPTHLVKALRARTLSWLEEEVIERVPAGYPGEGRLVYPKLLQFWGLMAYVGWHYAQGLELSRKFLFDDGEDPVHFPFRYLATTLMDIAAEYFLETAEAVFQKGSFAKGAIIIDSNSVDLTLIRRTALMTIEAEDDDLAAPGQTRAAHSMCRSIPEETREEVLVPNSGHFSLFHGGKCRSVVAPKISKFFERAERIIASHQRKTTFSDAAPPGKVQQ